MQAVASELSQLTQRSVLESLRHRTKLPNTSLNHEKLLLLFLSVSGMSFPYLCLTVWSVPLSVPPQLPKKGRIFYLKHYLDYGSMQRDMFTSLAGTSDAAALTKTSVWVRTHEVTRTSKN